MTGKHITLGILWVALVMAVLGYLTTAARLQSQTPPEDLWLNTTTVSPLVSPASQERTAPGGSRLDLYGNEVDDAVGDYRQDVQGNTYERHSPATEVPVPGQASV